MQLSEKRAAQLTAAAPRPSECRASVCRAESVSRLSLSSPSILCATGQLIQQHLTSPRRGLGTEAVNPFTFSNRSSKISSTKSPSHNVAMATGGGPTLVARRPSSHSLRRLRISRSLPDPFDCEDGVRLEEDVEEEGEQLFRNFVHEQMEAETPEAVQNIEIL